MHLLRSSVVLCLALAVALPAASAADWPQWRGPNRDGVAPESPPLADAWPVGIPRFVWRTERLLNQGHESGHSSPVVAYGRVFLYVNRMDKTAPGGAQDGLVCLNAGTGTKLWSVEYPADSQNEVRSQGGTPCVVAGRVYVTGRKRVYCFAADSGRLLWQSPIPSQRDGISSSFAVVAGVAVVNACGFIGFDAQTGAVRWQHSEGPMNGGLGKVWGDYPSPVPWPHGGKTYILCCRLKVTCLDPATGDALWEMPWENGGSWWGNSSPAVTGDTMVIQRHDGLECYILSEQGPREIWHIPHHEVASTPVLYQGHVYTLGGGDYGRRATVCCATLENGDVTWERDLDEAGCSTPIVADGKLFGYVDSGRKLAMWRTSPEDYAMLSLARVNADGYSSPAFSDGKLFVRLEDGVACYDLNRGANLPPTAVMEGERMPVGATTAPELLPQDQDVLSYGWSGGMQLFVRFDHVGQCVDFPVRVTHPGAYEISACMTRAADYGIVQFSVKGQALGAPFDGFSAHVTPTGPILLGTLNLPAGVTTLRLTIVGKNAASTGLLAGLDAMLFRR